MCARARGLGLSEAEGDDAGYDGEYREAAALERLAEEEHGGEGGEEDASAALDGGDVDGGDLGEGLVEREHVDRLGAADGGDERGRLGFGEGAQRRGGRPRAREAATDGAGLCIPPRSLSRARRPDRRPTTRTGASSRRSPPGREGNTKDSSCVFSRGVHDGRPGLLEKKREKKARERARVRLRERGGHDDAPVGVVDLPPTTGIDLRIHV